MCPVRPTFQAIRSSFVVAVLGANFQAIAPRGSRPTTPSCAWRARSSTFTTTPSISKSSRSRRSSQARQAATTESRSSWTSMSGFTRKPRSRKYSSDWCCEVNSTPSCAPIEYAHIESGREAVSFGSSWRIEPAAELRGFANVGSPASARCSLRRANAASGR
jgi:hypothetical protein